MSLKCENEIVNGKNDNIIKLVYITLTLKPVLMSTCYEKAKSVEMTSLLSDVYALIMTRAIFSYEISSFEDGVFEGLENLAIL